MSYTEAQLAEIQETIADHVKVKTAVLKAQLDEELIKKQEAHRDVIRVSKRLESYIRKNVHLDLKIAELRAERTNFINWAYKVLNEMDKILPCAYTEPWMLSPLRQEGVELVRPKVKVLHNPRGVIRSKLMAAGVVFKKNEDTGVWTATLGNEVIGESKQLGECVTQAAVKTGEK